MDVINRIDHSHIGGWATALSKTYGKPREEVFKMLLHVAHGLVSRFDMTGAQASSTVYSIYNTIRCNVEGIDGGWQQLEFSKDSNRSPVAIFKDINGKVAKVPYDPATYIPKTVLTEEMKL